MNYPMLIVGGLLVLDWSVDENRKNASILDCRRLPVEGQTLPLCPLWLIDVVVC
jgi:hypothetical protein